MPAGPQIGERALDCATTSMRSLLFCIVVLAAAATAACAVTGDPIPAIDVSASLPVVPTISERVNGRNDGTTFEPCTAYRAEELIPLGIAPSSISDAAFSDSPNFRGCDWLSPDRITFISQILGDEKSLDNYKRKHSYRKWQPDREVNGRSIATATDSNDGCIAAFMSMEAIVVSGIRTSTAGRPSPGLKQECDKAFAFASLATSKAP
ncbi:DUF3558 domain-containing protein [Tsukamurella strandjordii]|uniref:DUF3558 family protein n=1 Tax=Tsukamurella TaxID=2060 RepID=UPI001C7D5911|nr:DUF3558 family protein [Tsukamurella sp. TY48]GIZ98513.1 hypothetical protein TTY48_31250 [Tsukamurella sp. TY48]